MSLRIVSSASADFWIVIANSAASGGRSISVSSPDIPTTAFIGVRISWLILARNSLFAALARRADSFAFNVCRNATASDSTRTSNPPAPHARAFDRFDITFNISTE